jgi:single-stranded DNA-binding protein
VSFFDVETWSKLAEHCYNLAHKGRGVRVVGRLKQDRWNGSDGKSHSKITIVAEHVEFRPEFKKDGSPADESGLSAGTMPDREMPGTRAPSGYGAGMLQDAEDYTAIRQPEAVVF